MTTADARLLWIVEVRFIRGGVRSTAEQVAREADMPVEECDRLLRDLAARKMLRREVDVFQPSGRRLRTHIVRLKTAARHALRTAEHEDRFVRMSGRSELANLVYADATP